MKKIYSLLFVSTFLLNLTAVFGQTAADADIVVDINGTGDYTTLQAAINAVESNSDRRTVIYIKRGLYNTEKLIVPEDKQNVTLIGESRDETIISYHIYDCSGGLNNKCPAEDVALWTGDVIATSATLTINGDGFRAENLTIQNTAGPVGQALAITVNSDKNMFVNCNLLGYQDTIFLRVAGVRSYFQGCLVLGRTDYIYGAGIAFFQECEIRSYGGGWITAPSTPETQKYGYVFNECELTYSDGSPRNGDDGNSIALGRPWHNYPKVTWLNSYFCAEINPLGWPTTWNMEYAATSDKLELYEYNNTGPGADMSGRANWVGIRELAANEDTLYTLQKVMNGTDGWDPSAEAPLAVVYNWTDSAAANSNWLDSLNWSTKTLPETGETGVVDSGFVVLANTGTFTADLQMQPGSKIHFDGNDTVTYLSLAGVTILCDASAIVTGKISTKDTVAIDVTGELSLNTTFTGVKDISFNKAGTVNLQQASASFDGNWLIKNGTVSADSDFVFGTGNVTVSNGGKLIINSEEALHIKSVLSAETGATIELNADIVLSEFYIDGIIQPVGDYDASTNPGLLSGDGSIKIGRPDSFEFLGGTWDSPTNYSPALLPEAGETVYTSVEMETSGVTFVADLIVTSTGSIRLRGTHTCTGLITMEDGAAITYATSGDGFTLNAPIYFEGDVYLKMNSRNETGSSMVLPGNISGSATAYAANTRDVENSATVVLQGDNSGFNGIWDLTTASYNANGTTAIRGESENALGFGTVNISENNQLILSHNKCAGDTLKVNFLGTGKIVLEADIYVNSFILDSVSVTSGVYTSTELPDQLEGTFTLYVGEEYTVPEEPEEPETPNSIDDQTAIEKMPVRYLFNQKLILVENPSSEINLYSTNGAKEASFKNETVLDLNNYPKGVYILQYKDYNTQGTMKIVL